MQKCKMSLSSWGHVSSHKGTKWYENILSLSYSGQDKLQCMKYT